jgi:hypothetical protein
LDTQLAERIILASGFYIQIDNKFINSGDVNFKNDSELSDNMYLCRDSLNSLGLNVESLIIEDDK